MPMNTQDVRITVDPAIMMAIIWPTEYTLELAWSPKSWIVISAATIDVIAYTA